MTNKYKKFTNYTHQYNIPKKFDINKIEIEEGFFELALQFVGSCAPRFKRDLKILSIDKRLETLTEDDFNFLMDKTKIFFSTSIQYEFWKLVREKFNKDTMFLMFDPGFKNLESLYFSPKDTNKDTYINDFFKDVTDEVNAKNLKVKNISLKNCNLCNKHGLLDLVYNNLRLIPTLESLNLHNTIKEGNSIKELSESLSKLENLKKLNLVSNKLNYENDIFIANIIKNCKKLEHLEISSNNLGDNGVRYLSESLENTNNLNYFCIVDNNITSIGMKILLKSLIKNSSIKELKIGINKMGIANNDHNNNDQNPNENDDSNDDSNDKIENKAVLLLSRLIENNNTIEKFSFQKNHLSFKEIIFILKSLLKNGNLKYINIASNLFEIEQIKMNENYIELINRGLEIKINNERTNNYTRKN